MAKKKTAIPPTSDLSRFGVAALDDAVSLLKVYMFRRSQFTGNGVRICFSPRSGHVFLVNEARRIMKLHDGELREWGVCRICGVAGFINAEEPAFESDSMCERCSKEGYEGCLYSKLDAV